MTLPQPITAYIQAANAHDTLALFGTLTADATVTDERRAYCGHKEIQEWSKRTFHAYQATFDVLEVTQTHHEAVVTAQVTGTFNGSPLPLRFSFIIRGNKTATLTIRG